MMIDPQLDYPQLGIGAVKDLLRMHMEIRQTHERGSHLAFWGQPGVGKTEAARELCEEMGWHHAQVMVPNMDTVESKGYPKYDEKADAYGFKPLKQWPTEIGPGILVLDEYRKGTPLVQGGLNDLLTYGRIGEYVMPRSWLILLTGNLEKHKAAVMKSPTDALDRVAQYEIMPSAKASADYFEAKGYNSAYCEWIRENPEFVEEGFDPDAKISSTSRSIEDAFRVLDGSAPLSLKAPSVHGYIGGRAGASLLSFIESRKMDGPKLTQVLIDPEGAPLADNVIAQSHILRKWATDVTKSRAPKLITYVNRHAEEQRAAFATRLKETAGSDVLDLPFVRRFIEENLGD